MHVEGPQIYEMNRQTNNFQNICTMLQAKIDRQVSKSPILVDTNLGYLTLEGPGRQTVDTRSTSGLPLKTWGYDGSNQLCGRQVASKLSAHEPATFFSPWTRKLAKTFIFGLMFSKFSHPGWQDSTICGDQPCHSVNLFLMIEKPKVNMVHHKRKIFIGASMRFA